MISLNGIICILNTGTKMKYEDYLKELQQKIADLLMEHEDRFDDILGVTIRSSALGFDYVYDGEKFVKGKVPV